MPCKLIPSTRFHVTILVNMVLSSERVSFTIGTCLVHTLSYGIPNLILYFIHVNKWFAKYKIQGSDAFPEPALIRECIKDNLVGHLVIVPLAAYFGFPVFQSFGMTVSGPLPSGLTVLRDFVVFIAINDTLFYWVHRALHHKSIYKYIHKKHHEPKAPIGIFSKYAHPVEDLLVNILPTILGPFLIGTHCYVFWLWLAIRLFETVDAHSGYSFPYNPYHMFPFQGGADRHDFHHSHNVGCFGSFTIFWDWITGTDKQFLEFYAKKQAESKKAA